MIKHGHIVDIASNGEEALLLMSKSHYDVVITDIGMPVMNGIQLATQARKLYPEVRIIILSGWGNSNSIQDVSEISDFVLGKPVRNKEILSAIQSVMATKVI